MLVVGTGVGAAMAGVGSDLASRVCELAGNGVVAALGPGVAVGTPAAQVRVSSDWAPMFQLPRGRGRGLAPTG